MNVCDLETSVSGCAGIPPSVARFHAVCGIVTVGVDQACISPVDVHLEGQGWLSLAFELLSENPLVNPANDWKTTLTLLDEQIMTDGALKVMRSLVSWTKLVPKENPLAVAVVEAVGRFYEGGILHLDLDGNLSMDGTIFQVLHRAMTSVGLARRKMSGLPFDGNFQLDHTWNCRECETRLRSVFDFFRVRTALYVQAEDDATRRKAFSIGPRDNHWFGYYMKEYCNPTEFHFPYADQNVVDVSRIKGAMACVDAMSEKIVNVVAGDATDKVAAEAMVNAWKEVSATFSMRAISGQMPSYTSQRDFAREFDVFAKRFDEAVSTIGIENRVLVQTSAENLVEEEALAFPANTGDASEYRSAVKRFCNTLAGRLINSEKVAGVFDYPTARNYILSCTSGQPHYASCRKIREAIEIFGWKGTSLLTFCKGGGQSKAKCDYEHQAKLARTKKTRQQDWVGVGLADPDRLQ